MGGGPRSDGGPEYEVQQLLKFKMRWGRPYVLVRWAGCDASRDTWEPLDNLTNCEAAIAAFERTSGRPLPRPAPPPPAVAAPLPIPPAGFTIDAAPTGDLRAEFVGRTLLYWWQADRWQRCTVARLCPRVAVSHVVAYTLQTSVLRGTGDALLDAASYGGTMANVGSCFLLLPLQAWTWLQTPPRSPAGPAARDLCPDFQVQVGRWLVTSGPWPGRAGRAGPAVTVAASFSAAGLRVSMALVYIAEPGAR